MTTVPAFHLPGFPQLFTAIIGDQIARVERILLHDELGSCCQPSCPERAAISDLETGCGYCLRHFQSEVSL